MNEIEPIGCVEKHKAKAAPTVTKTAEMGWAAALIWPENDGNFGNAGADLGSLDDELQGELHTGTAQVQFVVEGATEAAHAAIAVSHSRVEK